MKTVLQTVFFVLVVIFGFTSTTFAADTTLYVNTASTAGGDCTTNAITGANRACATLFAAEAKLPADITVAGGANAGIWTIIAEGQVADTTAVIFSGTVTDDTHYIVVMATSTATYGRHQGVYNTNKYRLETSSASVSTISIADNYIRIDGLQIKRTASSGSPTVVNIAVNSASSDIRISNNIITSNFSGSVSAIAGIGQSYGYIPNVKVWNNVMYNFTPVTSTAVAIATTGGSWYLYNNTIYNTGTGITRSNTATIIAVNNLIASSTAATSGTFAVGTDYNATNNPTMGYTVTGSGNSHDRNSTNIPGITFSFISTTTGSEDFHLLSSDTGAMNFGQSNPGSGLFSDDINSQARIGSWDIGTDEYDTPPDSEKPVVTAFVIPTDYSSTTLTIPITTFTATDNNSVTGYLLTETSDTPATDNQNWSPTVQTSYTFSTAGAYTLYAWAKDAVGNISTSLNDSVNVTLPSLNNYWVSPTGAATWANCHSDTPLSGTNACSRVTANANATAGDTVYFRGGTYTVAGSGLDYSGIKPTNSGTSGNKIIFARYANEVPIITSSVASTYGIYLSGKQYIKIDGFTVQDIATWVYIIDSSSYNEITNSTFNSTAGNEAGSGVMIDGTICTTHDCWNTHNWIHNSTFSKRHNVDPCAEGTDLMRIGSAYGSGNTEENDNYNTVEDNVMAYAGHGVIFNYGMHNVIRDNIVHNEPWITGCTNYQGSTSNTSLTIGIGSKTLTTQTGLSLSGPIGIVDTSNYSNAMRGSIISYNSGTGALVVNVTYTTGSGTHSAWTLSQENVPYYENASYNNLFGHRNVQLSDDYGREGIYSLVEGNRLGHASNNPGNGGPMNLDVAGTKYVIRYNDIFNGMSSGVLFKYASSEYYPCVGGRTGNGACGGTNNRVFNNTIYHNGYGYDWRVYGDQNVSYSMLGIAQWNAAGTGSTGNVIKNNIVYDNKEGDICQLGLHSVPCTSASYDTVGNNWLTTNGDPKFTNMDLTDPTSTTLPNLTLQSDSGAINSGTYLARTVGTGSNSTTLVVDDALYFQDGTWGSDLARGVDFFPDWIAIGTVNNIVKISSINYDTNTITLASPMTWNNGADIWLYKKSDGTRVLYGSAPDMGASENQSALSSIKKIIIFNFVSLSSTGVIDEGSKTITLSVPYGTDITTLVPTIVITGSSISPNTGVSTNFTNPVTYTVTAEDSSTQTYTVNVTVDANPNPTPVPVTFSSGSTGYSILPQTPTNTCPRGLICTPVSHTIFTKTINPYTTSNDVKQLQIFLNKQGYTIATNGPGSPGNETNYFGPATKNALILFQNAHSQDILTPSGLTQGTGILGPLTISLVNKMLSSSTPVITTKPLTATTTPFTRDLYLGSTGDDVKQLQIFLNTKGFTISTQGPGSPGNETNYFGSLTKDALTRYQNAHTEDILSPQGLTSGTGYFGKGTRGVVNMEVGNL